MPEDCLRDEVCITETNTECSCTLPPPPGLPLADQTVIWRMG